MNFCNRVFQQEAKARAEAAKHGYCSHKLGFALESRRKLENRIVLRKNMTTMDSNSVGTFYSPWQRL